MTDDVTRPPADPDLEHPDPDRPDPCELERHFVADVERLVQNHAPRPETGPATRAARHAQLAADAMDLAGGFLDVENYDKAIEWYGVAHDYGALGADTLRELVMRLREALFDDGLQRLLAPDGQPQPEYSEHVLTAAHALAEAIVANAKTLAFGMLSRAHIEADTLARARRTRNP